MFTASKEELTRLSLLNAELRAAENPTLDPLTPELLEALIRNVNSSWQFVKRYNGPQEKPTFEETVFSKAASDACGCTGPRDGDPYCGCLMSHYRYEYRYEIALALIERNFAPIAQ